MRTRLLLLAGALGLTGALGALPAGASTTTTAPPGVTVTYGPTWGRFTADFPQKPKNTTGSTVTAGFPSGTKGSAYSVSKQKNLFGNAPVPPPPSTMVVATQLPNATDARQLVAGLQSEAGSQGAKVTLDGYTGFRWVGSVGGPLNKGAEASDASAKQGTEVLAKGKVAYIILAVEGSTGQAKAFLQSFHPAG
jgi:hypothetical protein